LREFDEDPNTTTKAEKAVVKERIEKARVVREEREKRETVALKKALDAEYLRWIDKANPFIKPTPGVTTDSFRPGHSGIDISKYGEPVIAAADGTITEITDEDSGNIITIEHSGGFETRYIHMRDLLVVKDDPVTQGQQIGTQWNYGKVLTGDPLHTPTAEERAAGAGAHLHYELLYNGIPQNPEFFW
jgi:murein DD-endopeptidase MepM/ murein hydrolase activator NlpD